MAANLPFLMARLPLRTLSLPAMLCDRMRASAMGLGDLGSETKACRLPKCRRLCGCFELWVGFINERSSSTGDAKMGALTVEGIVSQERRKSETEALTPPHRRPLRIGPAIKNQSIFNTISAPAFAR